MSIQRIDFACSSSQTDDEREFADMVDSLEDEWYKEDNTSNDDTDYYDSSD